MAIAQIHKSVLTLIYEGLTFIIAFIYKTLVKFFFVHGEREMPYINKYSKTQNSKIILSLTVLINWKVLPDLWFYNFEKSIQLIQGGGETLLLLLVEVSK